MLSSFSSKRHKYIIYLALRDSCPPSGLLKDIMHTATFKETLKRVCDLRPGVPRIFDTEDGWLYITDGKQCSYKTHYGKTGWCSIVNLGTILNIKETIYYIGDERWEDRLDAAMILTVMMIATILLAFFILKLVARKSSILLLDLLCGVSIISITIIAILGISTGKIVGRWRNILITNYPVYIGIFLLIPIALHISPKIMIIPYILTIFIIPMIFLDKLYIKISKLYFLLELIVEGDKDATNKIMLELMGNIVQKFFRPPSHIAKRIREKFHVDLAEEWKKLQGIVGKLKM